MQLTSLITIFRALNEAEVTYLVVGGLAVVAHGYEPFDMQAEVGRAVWVDLDKDVSVPILALPALIKMKREAGRPQDLADIAELGRRQQ